MSNSQDLVPIKLDLRALATLMAGGVVEIPSIGVRIEAGGDAARIIWNVRSRLNGSRWTQKPLPIEGDSPRRKSSSDQATGE